MSGPELKPCPRCGSHPTVDRGLAEFHSDETYILCPAVLNTDGREVQCGTYAYGAAHWNRRADLPPTLPAALALPEVRALVDAAKGLLFAHDHGNGLEGWHNTRERMRAALRAIGEGGE